MFIFHCPHCLQKIECEDSDAGVTAPCPGCGRNIVVRKKTAPNKSDKFFVFNCPLCKKEIKAISADYGNIIECPGCGKKIIARTEDIVDKDNHDPGQNRYSAPVYKSPVLTELFIWCCWLNGISALIAFVFIIHHINRRNESLAWGSAAWMITAISAAVICYGIAEFFRYVGRISDNSDAIREFVAKSYYEKK